MTGVQTCALPICGPILTVANWSGTWPGLVGMLNLNGSLTKAGVPYSTLWSETFNDPFFKDGLRTLGFNTGASESPITPVIAGDAARAMRLSDRLFEEGVFAQGIGFPTVPRDKARVRTIVTATHTKADLQYALDAFRKVGTELGLI